MTRFSARLLVVLALVGVSVSAQRGGPIPQQLVFTPYHANGTYDVGETVGWTVTPGPAPPTYSYKWTIRRNNPVVLKEGALDLSSGKATIEIVGDQPGMIYVAVEAAGDLTPTTCGSSERGSAPWAQYWTQHRVVRSDTVNFASRIKAPVMAGMGFIDTISPPAGVWTVLNQIAGPVEVLRMIDSEHDNLTPDKGAPVRRARTPSSTSWCTGARSPRRLSTPRQDRRGAGNS